MPWWFIPHLDAQYGHVHAIVQYHINTGPCQQFRLYLVLIGQRVNRPFEIQYWKVNVRHSSVSEQQY